MWTREAIRRARKSFLRLPLKEQLTRVYEIIHAHYNQNSDETILMIFSNMKKNLINILQVQKSAVKLFSFIMEFLSISITRHSGL